MLSFVVGLASADTSFNPVIRIKLARFYPVGIQQVNVSSSAPFGITDQNGTSIVQALAGTTYQFNNDATGQVSISSTSPTVDSEESQSGANAVALYYVVHPTPGSTLTVTGPGPLVDEHHYRGDIIVLTGLSVVNSLPLEDYLKGVIKPEIGASAPVEALKAQAIAARTYTVRNMGKMSQMNADMDDTTRTQAYLGADGETPTIDQAVDDTVGEVLLFEGTPINAVYSTDCGGETAVGTVDEPYLSPVSDPECASEPPWQLDLSAEQVKALFETSPTAGDDRIVIRVVQKDSSGRVTELKIVQGDQEKIITGIEFRKLVGYDILKSTLFKMGSNSDGSYHVVGQGWGHGMGLCQRGAIYLAAHSSLCNDILLHYYTGVQIGQLQPSMIPLTPTIQQISSTPTGSTLTVP